MLKNKIFNVTSAYIHIPFCKSICHYCDFNKVFMEGQPVDQYIHALLNEIRLTISKEKTDDFLTIYIGGGTPTCLNTKQLDSLLSGINQLIPISKSKEFTIEANPEDLTEDKILVLKKYGVNRISLGAQTFDNKLLRKCGRKHTSKDIYSTIYSLKRNQFDNISIDLIYALPGQTMESFRDTLRQALELSLPHYSIYSLILEKKTMFMNWAKEGNLKLPSLEKETQMFQEITEKMVLSGYDQYEISNFTKYGKKSKHNLVYWNNENYYGFGAGACGYLNNIRYRNFGPIQHYIKPLSKNKLPIFKKEKLTLENQIEEEVFLGLRKKEGISQNKFLEKFGQTFLNIYGKVVSNLIANELLAIKEDNVFLTNKGVLIGNEVFEKFLLKSD